MVKHLHAALAAIEDGNDTLATRKLTAASKVATAEHRPALAEALSLIERGKLKRAGNVVRKILAAAEKPPAWTWEERMAVDLDFLRTGRTADQRRRGKYSMSGAYGILPPAERARELAAHVEAGRTGFAFSVADGPSKYWDVKTPFVLSPKVVAQACQEIIAAGMMPVPILYTQDDLRNGTLASLEARMRAHAAEWGDLCGLLWLTFEHNEAVHPASVREGLRGDDWITALAGRAAREFGRDVPILVHQTSGEHHDHTTWAAGGKAGEAPTKQAVLAFQFPSWNPAPDAMVEYVNDDKSVTRMTSREAHARDTAHMLIHPYAWLPWEYGQSIGASVEWDDEDVFALGRTLRAAMKQAGRHPGSGCGA